MILSVDPDRPLPVYEQVREQITRMAASGSLATGARLPTIRQLAADLGLAKGTIERAYELLESAGVIESKGRKGTFVRARARASPVEQMRGLDDAARSLVVVARQLGADERATVEALGRVWRDL